METNKKPINIVLPEPKLILKRQELFDISKKFKEVIKNRFEKIENR